MMVTSPVPLPNRISGYRSRVVNGILDYIESLRPISTPSVWHEWRPGGVASHARDQSVVPARYLFDLYEIGEASVKVRGTGGRASPTKKLFCLRGTWLAVTGGTYEFDTDIDLSAKASGYLCIDVTRTNEGGTATLEHHEGANPPDGDEDNEYFPLWYIPIASNLIVRSGIEDWRNTIGARVTGIA
ncbi:MAG: hypothetical protein FJ276_32990 [Planctomycetes bacterium]|nr:hypothetical protein [Planctomycetota bacterium]